jgi:uncharacterized protein YdaU (DUF1376 family)
MYYYQFNVGDYASHTRHLTPIEDVTYRRLLDLAYTTEKPISADIHTISRLINLRDFHQEIQDVLNEFFELVEDGWINNRVLKEIEKTGGKSEKARMSAKMRWDKKRNADLIRTQCERNANAQENNANASNTNEESCYPRPKTQDTKTQDTKKRETSVPDKFEVTPEMFSWATEQGLPEMRIKPETENFLDRCRAKDIKYLNWVAAWRTWIRNAVKFTKA